MPELTHLRSPGPEVSPPCPLESHCPDIICQFPLWTKASLRCQNRNHRGRNADTPYIIIGHRPVYLQLPNCACPLRRCETHNSSGPRSTPSPPPHHQNGFPTSSRKTASACLQQFPPRRQDTDGTPCRVNPKQDDAAPGRATSRGAAKPEHGQAS